MTKDDIKFRYYNHEEENPFVKEDEPGKHILWQIQKSIAKFPDSIPDMIKRYEELKENGKLPDFIKESNAPEAAKCEAYMTYFAADSFANEQFFKEHFF